MVTWCLPRQCSTGESMNESIGNVWLQVQHCTDDAVTLLPYVLCPDRMAAAPA